MTNKTESTIRPYGPGKFDTILDSYVYDVSVGPGCDDETGDVQECGRWYGLMRHGRSIFQDHDPNLEPLNDAEREMLTSCSGVIVSEDSQGFVSVEYFDTDEELSTAWDACIAETTQEEEEEEA